MTTYEALHVLYPDIQPCPEDMQTLWETCATLACPNCRHQDRDKLQAMWIDTAYAARNDDSVDQGHFDGPTADPEWLFCRECEHQWMSPVGCRAFDYLSASADGMELAACCRPFGLAALVDQSIAWLTLPSGLTLKLTDEVEVCGTEANHTMSQGQGKGKPRIYKRRERVDRQLTFETPAGQVGSIRATTSAELNQALKTALGLGGAL